MRELLSCLPHSAPHLATPGVITFVQFPIAGHAPLLEAGAGRERCGRRLEDLLQPRQAEQVQGRHLYVGLVAIRHVDGLPGLHELLHDL